MKTNNKNNLLVGLIGLIGVITIVSVIGYFASRPQKIIIQGEVEATEYRMSGKVPGRVTQYWIKEGDNISKGDTLAELYIPELNAKLDQAQAAKWAATAQSNKAIKGAREEQIASAYQIWQKAEAGAEISKKTYDRVNNLYKQEVLSEQKRDEAYAQYKAATATAKAAKSQYEMALNGAETEDKDAAKALVDRAQGAVNEVYSYLQERWIISPTDGQISEIFPNIGELVGSGAPIVSITDINDMWFIFNIREELLNEMNVGTELEVVIPALAYKKFKLKVTYMKAMASYATWRATKVSGQYDTKTFEVKAIAMEEIPNLRPGMTAIIEKMLK
jgi:HlyD family secretion protein